FAEAWNKRATVQYLAGNYQRSLEDCGEVIRRNPVHFGALSGYGQVYFALQDYEQAIRWWRRALEVNPNMLGVEVQLRHAEELLREKRGRST
ncbi:MAG: tetratricopeptide repeat protein, partial [Betaproteobacteria bacterium]|nr:tetratricopeptide repeat protein [Betaproteobacteria bacterium]